MSATNRGHTRHANDLYATPEEAFKPLLPYVRMACDTMPFAGPVWEPACGDGRLITWMEDCGIKADGRDANDGYDFLRDTDMHACILTNPPFSLAMEFVEHALNQAPEAFMLLRLNFLASAKRKEFWKRHEPDALFVLSSRPSFTENGKTDATDYAWFYWGRVWKGIHHL